MEESDVTFKILLRFFQNPLLKVDEVKSVGIFYLFGLEPLHIKWEMVRNFLPIENTVDHVATE